MIPATPKKLKLVGLSLLLILILTQVWVWKSKSQETIETIQETVHKKPTHQSPAPESKSLLYGFKGFSSRLPRLQYKFNPEPIAYTQVRESRRDQIKQSFLHAWKGYKRYALGRDELAPLSNKAKTTFGGWGATMIDSLSTLLVMDLSKESTSLISRIQKIDFVVDENISVFESTIRYIGGLLSAYELDDRKQEVLLKRAMKLGNQLLRAFENPTGLPHHFYNLYSGEADGNETLVAEVGTIQLEFMMLSQLSGIPFYGQKAQNITDLLDNMGYEHGLNINGLYPTKIDVRYGTFNNDVATFGAMGDSVYEYFLKQHLLVDGTVPQYGRMYKESIDNMKKYMLQQIPHHKLLFLPDFNTKNRTFGKTMDHLTCFVPGMLAMGSITFDRPEDLEIAKNLLESCVFMYRTTSTGLSPDSWSVRNAEPYNPLTFGKSKEELERLWPSENQTIEENPMLMMNEESDMTEPVEEYQLDYLLPPVEPRPRSLKIVNPTFPLRPETIESLFILYRITGDQKYQEYGWEIYQAIERWAKTKSGYATLSNVDIKNINLKRLETNQLDSMESFLMSETFKYLYLLFSPPDLISLDKFIFNTEGHPIIRKHWNWEKILIRKEGL